MVNITWQMHILFWPQQSRVIWSHPGGDACCRINDLDRSGVLRLRLELMSWEATVVLDTKLFQMTMTDNGHKSSQMLHFFDRKVVLYSVHGLIKYSIEMPFTSLHRPPCSYITHYIYWLIYNLKKKLVIKMVTQHPANSKMDKSD